MQINSDVCRCVYTLKDNSTSFIKMEQERMKKSVHMSVNEEKGKIYEVNEIPIDIEKYFTTMMEVVRLQCTRNRIISIIQSPQRMNT